MEGLKSSVLEILNLSLETSLRWARGMSGKNMTKRGEILARDITMRHLCSCTEIEGIGVDA